MAPEGRSGVGGSSQEDLRALWYQHVCADFGMYDRKCGEAGEAGQVGEAGEAGFGGEVCHT